ncbi:PIG-L family deacetylase [Arthrobacter sp. I2-34]|uniref:PIG-L family deacetylase n=1 Tax=Arthrobacter hankyongi TaxID=2904801 RepID=A0ABS9L1X6_9MICC|nr:PIG-L family deacetylase [Arthrobacter hankyongi]MCG2620534.1 PIG-L family deacetylase [Arthrobacter hankyongi]
MSTNNPWLFLSPHLDDAVLSCGALLEAQSGRRELTVATVFTESEQPPHTRSARAFMRLASVEDAAELFEARRAEDRAVLRDLGAKDLHLGATDAIYRRRRQPRIGVKPLGHLLPELVHRYPTYRLNIVGGRISRGDRSLMATLGGRIAELMEQTKAELIFCPLGVGRHVDHLVTRALGAAFPERVVYYSDFPYNQSSGPDPAFVAEHRLDPWLWDDGLTDKERWIRGYVTQADALFPEGSIPVVPETYFAAS